MTPPQPPADPDPGAGPLLSQRAVLILLAAVVIGGVVGALTLLSRAHPATSVLAGLTATGVCIIGLHKLIGD